MKGAFLYLKKLSYILGEEKRKTPFLLLLFSISSIFDVIGISLIGPYLSLILGDSYDNKILEVLIESFSLNNYNQIVIGGGLLIIAIFSLKTLVLISVNYAIFSFCNNQVVILREKLFNLYQSMPYVKHIERNSSDYIQSINVFSVQFVGSLMVVSRWLCESITAISILTLLIYTQGIIPIYLLLTMAIFLWSYSFIFGEKIKKAGELSAISNAKSLKNINETIAGFKEIRILSIKNFFNKKIYKNSKIFSAQRTKEQIIAYAPRQLIELLLVFFIISIILSIFMIGKDISSFIPFLGMLLVATARLLPTATSFSTGLTSLQFSKHGIFILYDDLIRYSDETRASNPRNIMHEPLEKFEMKNVFYKYPKSEIFSLQNVNFTFNRGESIGIIGTSGAGKTTLIDLILSLLHPTKGEVLFNGKPIEDKKNEWRSQIAYIPQEIFLMDDTIKKNITLGVDEKKININKLNDAIKNSMLSSLINSLPEGVDTKIGERGVRFSGGQRQRLALARAFYFGKDVLIMDEATSSIDSKTEKEIVKHIRKLKKDKTLLVIAHRLTTIEDCDVVYRIEEGSIVESGSPKQFLNLN